MRKLLIFMCLMPFYAIAGTITGIKADGNTKVFKLDDIVSIKVDNESAFSVRSSAGVEGGFRVIKFNNEVTGVTDNQPSVSFMFYPNPVKDVLFLIGANAETKFEIVSATGKVVMRGKGESVNVSKLACGQYVIVCDGISVKFIKE